MSVLEPLVYAFGAFRLNAAERQLLRDGDPVALTDKVFDLLLLLLQSPGQLISKAELMRRLWPDSIVEENNLTVNISILRKALGDTAADHLYIETVARRGYRFTAQVTMATARVEHAPAGDAPVARNGDKRAFVGRDRELAELDDLLADALEGHGRVVFITGAPGMGKTELVTQFLDRVRSASLARFTAKGRCLEQYGPSEAYLPFLEAVRSLLTGPDSAVVGRLLKQHAPTWSAQFPMLASDEVPRNAARDTVSVRMLRELSNLLETLSALKPVLLVLEDLHWADPSSCDLLRLLAERCAPWRVLIVATLRAEQVELEKHPLRNIKRELLAHDLGEELVLPLLDRGCIFSYLDARFQPNDFPSELSELIASTSEGQPLFLTRLVQLMVERADIVRAGDEYQLTRPVAELKLGVPDTIRGLIERKLESLSDPDRRTLEYASVLGTEFSTAIVARLLAEDEVLLEERLDQLARAHRLVELLGEERVDEGRLTVRYRFAHVLYHAVLYDRLASKRRMLLHAEAAGALLEQCGAQSCCYAAQLALHFEAAREFERAIFYLMQAADNASRLNANREAIDDYARALALACELPAEKQVAHQIILRYNLGWCHHNAGNNQLALENFEAMLARTSSPPFTSATPEGEQARAAVFEYFAQPWRDAFGLYDMPRMPNQDRSMGAEAVQCEAYAALCYLLLLENRVDEMGARAAEYLACAESSNNQPRRAEALAWIGGRELHLGKLKEATALLEESLTLSRSLGHQRALFLALCDRAHVHYLLSEFELAELTYAESLRLTVGATGRIHCLLGLGRSRTHLGRVSSAISALSEAREIAEQIGHPYFRQALSEALGELLLELGEWNRAAEETERGLELARQRGSARGEIRGLLALSRVHCGLGDLSSAKSCLDQAETLTANLQQFDPPAGLARLRLALDQARTEYWFRHGEQRAAERHAQAWLSRATQAQSPRYVALSRHWLGRIRLARNELTAAIQEFEAALDALSPVTAPLVTWKVLANLASARQEAGEGRLSGRANRRAREQVEQIASEIEEAALRKAWFSSPEVARLLAVAELPPSSRLAQS